MVYIIVFLLVFQINHTNSFLSKEDKEQIDRIRNTIPDSVQIKFNTVFNQWVNNWGTDPKTKISSSTKTACTLKEYDILCSMGEEEVPLIIGKLVDYDKNFIGLQLYNKLQKDPNQKIYTFTSEQDKARKTVLHWLKHHR